MIKPAVALVSCLTWLAGLSLAHGQTVLSDTFADGDRTNNPSWFISQGAFNVSFQEANNNNASVNQFFTTAFSPIDLADQNGLRMTFSYRPEGTNLATVKVGFFDGVAPTADNWSQFNPGQPTRDWRGYYASIGVDGLSPTEIRRNDDAVDDHAFFAGTTIGATGTTITVAGSATFRVMRFELYRSGADLVLQIFEGATVDTLTSLGLVTDIGAPFFGSFNNLSLYQTTAGGNGHIRYDNILFEAFSLASPVAEPELAILPAGGNTVTIGLSNLTTGLTCHVWSSATMDLSAGTVVTSFPTVNPSALLPLDASAPVSLFWSTLTSP